jgi:hypothetical protein
MELVWDTDPSVDSEWTTSVTTVTRSQPPTRLSRLTVLLYLNDDFEGEANSYQPLAEKKSYDDVDYGESPPPPSVIASVRPCSGSVL